MKKILILALFSLTGCSVADRLNGLVNESTDSINHNRETVERSTEVINRNAQLINETNRVIAENRELIEKLNAK